MDTNKGVDETVEDLDCILVSPEQKRKDREIDVGTGEDSNDSWDLEPMMHDNLKMAAMMHGHKKSNTSSVYSYHGPLTLFDDQGYFNTTFRNPMEFHKATIHTNGGTMFERDISNDVFAEMLEKILFEVFLYEF